MDTAAATVNNTRIAKNTLVLYLRMIFLMVVSLYTSRVVLAALGVEDYGTYNVVGGVVAMFSFVINTMSAAISRYIANGLGLGDAARLRRVFATSLNIQIGLGIVVVALVETLGLWFLNTGMRIPPDRMQAARIVLHISALTAFINFLVVPYNAAIIAHERMTAFAYVSILEALGKLAVAFLITSAPIDRLIFYASMLAVVGALVQLVYWAYCRRAFDECAYRFIFDRGLLKEMTSFAGWNFLGTTAYLFNTQGVNMLMNVFFGVTVNAARGVAVQVDGAVKQMVNNFTTAINPQIMKSYARGDMPYMHSLICRSSKFSALLTFAFAIPLVIEAQNLLDLWLVNPPELTAVFLQLALVGTLLDNALGNSLFAAALATGRTKRYQIIVSLVSSLVFILTGVAYWQGMPPHAAYVIFAVVYAALLLVRLSLISSMVGISKAGYLRAVLGRSLPVLALASLPPLAVHCAMAPGFLRLVCVCAVSVPVTCALSYAIGLTPGERGFVREKTAKILHRGKKNRGPNG